MTNLYKISYELQVTRSHQTFLLIFLTVNRTNKTVVWNCDFSAPLVDVAYGKSLIF